MAKVSVKEKSSVTGEEKNTDKEKVVQVTLDMGEQRVVELIEDGFQIGFSGDDFLELSDRVVDLLDRKSLQRYFIAKTKVIMDKREGDVKRPDYARSPVHEYDVSDPMRHSVTDSLKDVRKRGGWHICWKDPRDLDACLRVGYKQVRDPDKKQQELIDSKKKVKEDFAGEEKGEVKMIGRRDNPELIAMECPQDLFDQHMFAVGYASSGRHAENKEEFFEKARRAGVIPIDGDKPVS